MLKKLSFLTLIFCLFFSTHAFAQINPNQGPRQMMEEFRQMFEEQNQRMNDLIVDFFENDRFGNFDDLQGLEFRSSLGGVSAAEVRKREDDRHIIFELDAQGLDPNALDVSVSGGMVSISGQIRREDSSETQEQFFQSTRISSFSRSFPVPSEADPHSVRVEQDEDKNKVLIKFDRLRI